MVNRRALDAGVYNFIIWGSGYLYLGKRTPFVVLIIIGCVLIRIESFLGGYLQLSTGPLGFYVFGWVASVVVNFAFAYDAYQLAVNEGPLHSRLGVGR